MKKAHLLGLLFLSIIFFPSEYLFAQEVDSLDNNLRKEAVKIFIDCQYCDMNYIAVASLLLLVVLRYVVFAI